MNAPRQTLRRWLLGLAAGLSFGASAQAADMIITSEIPLSVNPSPYIVQFIDEVKKRSGGAINGKYFDSSQLYNDRDALAALGTGSVQMVWPVTSRLEALDARIGVASLPFALSATEMGNKCFADGFTKMTSGYLEGRGIKVLGYLRTADLMFLMKSRDVQKLEDLRGAKIRVIAGKTMLDAIRSVQATPVAISASEMSAALSQGVIDGMLTSPAGWANVVGITAKYATLYPGMSLATSAVTVDRKWWDALPEAQRTMVQQTLDEIIARQWTETVKADEDLIKKMVGQGGIYRVAPPAEIERLKARMVPAGEEFRKQHEAVIRQTQELRKTCKI
jgi:TRAP-type C4-dicarboxylate transport system substrate-binding protein